MSARSNRAHGFGRAASMPLFPAKEFDDHLATLLGLLKPHAVVRVADDDTPASFFGKQSFQVFVDGLLGSLALLPGQQERWCRDAPDGLPVEPGVYVIGSDQRLQD